MFWELSWNPLCPAEFREGFLQKVAAKQALKAEIIRKKTMEKLSHAEVTACTKALRLEGA